MPREEDRARVERHREGNTREVAGRERHERHERRDAEQRGYRRQHARHAMPSSRSSRRSHRRRPCTYFASRRFRCANLIRRRSRVVAWRA